MNKIIFVFVLILVPTLVFSQQLPREVLLGQIVADSLSVENVVVLNVNTNLSTASDKDGEFSLYAREKDTLVFSSLTFNPKRIVLSKSDFQMNQMRIKLEISINNLDEVVISPYSLTGNLEFDQKNIKIAEMPKVNVRMALTANFEDDEKSSPDNKLMPGYVDQTYMMDFKKLGGKLIKLLSKPPEKKEVVFISKKIFPEAVQEVIAESFFLDTLQLEKEQIGLFLTFCESDLRARSLLDPKKHFQLIEFLIEQNKKYKLAQKE